MTDDHGYLLDNQQVQAGERFVALSALFDETTFRHARSVGLGPGWQVWEIGAGGATVPRWLASVVGPAGRVVATDIDTTWFEDHGGGFEVLRHDVGREPPPPGLFDLIHARLVLVHVPDRHRAVTAMVSALRPGGWLFLEEADPGLQPLACPDEIGAPERLANRLKHGFRVLMAERGVDLAFGRTLPRRMGDAGLEDVKASAYFPFGGPVCAELERATTVQIRDRLIDHDLATAAEIEQHLANIASGQLALTTSPMVSAMGRKPV